jgi:hypothetical protein
MQAARDPTAQGGGEPGHRVARRTVAEIGNQRAFGCTLVGERLRNLERAIKRVLSGDAMLLIDEKLVAPTPLRRADEQIAQGFDGVGAEHRVGRIYCVVVIAGVACNQQDDITRKRGQSGNWDRASTSAACVRRDEGA